MFKLLSIILQLGLFLGPVEASALKAADKAEIGIVQLLKNPGFELGKAKWSATGGSFTIDTSTPSSGGGTAVFDASAVDQLLQSSLEVVPTRLEGNRCLALVNYEYSGTAGDYQLEVQDGTNVIATAPLDPVTGMQPQHQIFTCPSSGSVRLQVRSLVADPGAIRLDDAHQGSPELRQVDVASAELVAEAKYANSGCIWATTSAVFADFPTQAACDSIIVLSSNYAVDTTDNDLPDIDFNYLPSGVYVVDVEAPIGNNTSATSDNHVRISDGTDVGPVTYLKTATSTSTDVQTKHVQAVFTYTSGGARNFKIQGTRSANTLQLFGSGLDAIELSFKVSRFPLGSEKALSLHSQEWHIDANIGGANPQMGTSAVTAYTEITNAGLDLVLNNGSASAEIACASGTAPEGLTCNGAAVNESIGIAFIPPRAGIYEACMTFGHFTDVRTTTGASVDATFQLVETSELSSAVVQEGNERTPTRVYTNSTAAQIDINSHKRCGLFKFDSVSKKVIRLEFEQAITATISNNEIIADRNTDRGQRDIHVTVRPWVSNSAVIIPDAVTSPSEGSGVKMCSWYGDQTATVTQEVGNCIDSTVDNGTGDYSFNFISGYWTSAPNCQVVGVFGSGPAGQEENRWIKTQSTSLLRIASTIDGNSAADRDSSIVCHGK